MRNTFRSFLTVIAVIGLVSLSFTACDNGTTTETVPGAVTNFAATPGNGQVSLSWSAPSNDGGAVITHYQVSSDNGANWVNASSNIGHTFTGLTNGTPYTFRVRAVNSIGLGVQSTATATPSASVENTDNRVTDVGTGSLESRRYRVEVYNITSATFDYLQNTYGIISYQDFVRNDVISKGHSTPSNTYNNQTFQQVLSIFTNVGNSIGLGSNLITSSHNFMTEVLQTNNRDGEFWWFRLGSNCRFFYVNRTNPGTYTVEVYNITLTTYNHLQNTYGLKTYQDFIRADVISRGHSTPMNTYTNQTFQQVLSTYESTANSIGLGSSPITSGKNFLTEALQTNNRNGELWWIQRGSNQRFFYINQE